MVNNRSGNNVRKESDIKAIADKIVAVTPLAVNIRQPGDLHERVKTDADG